MNIEVQEEFEEEEIPEIPEDAKPEPFSEKGSEKNQKKLRFEIYAN